MCHALIFDADMVIHAAIGELLASCGVSSCDDTWTERQAVAAAVSRSPDLLIVGDSSQTDSHLATVRRLSARNSAPILTITAEPERMRRRLAEALEGRWFINDIGSAVALARVAAKPMDDGHYVYG